MPSFTIEHDTKLPADETFKKVRHYFETSEGLKKLDGDMRTEFDEANKTGHIKGSKFDCELKVTGSTKVSIQVTIPLLLLPLKGTIQQTIKEKMTKILG